MGEPVAWRVDPNGETVVAYDKVTSRNARLTGATPSIKRYASGANVEFVEVGDELGVFVGGEHTRTIDGRTFRSANTLIWNQGGSELRLEGDLAVVADAGRSRGRRHAPAEHGTVPRRAGYGRQRNGEVAMRGRGLRVTIVIGMLSGLGMLGTVAGPAGAKTLDAVTSRYGIGFRSIIVDGQTRVERSSPGYEHVVTLDEPLQLRLVEPGGRRMVLGPPLTAGADAYHPGGRGSTCLVVVDVANGSTRAGTTCRATSNPKRSAWGSRRCSSSTTDRRRARTTTGWLFDGARHRAGGTAARTGQVSAQRGHERYRP